MKCAWKWALGSLLTAHGLLACGSDGKEAPPPWECFEYSSSCECRPPVCAPNDPNCVSFGSGIEVSACLLYDCCLLGEDGEGEPLCECRNDVTSCAAEAASRPGFDVVETCPENPPEGEPSACAAQGVNCSERYLTEQGLDGCCAGTVCDDSEGGVRTCRAAASGEEEAVLLCERASRAERDDRLRLVEPIETSEGTLAVDRVQFDFSELGAGACLGELQLTLDSSTVDCEISIDAGPARDADQKLIVTRVVIRGDECGVGDALIWISDDAQALAGTVAFNGVNCDGDSVLESYCLFGRFTIEIAGALVDDQDTIRFTSAIELEGVSCSESNDENGDCPP